MSRRSRRGGVLNNNAPANAIANQPGLANVPANANNNPNAAPAQAANQPPIPVNMLPPRAMGLGVPRPNQQQGRSRRKSRKGSRKSRKVSRRR
jgi:hypothetical protein